MPLIFSVTYFLVYIDEVVINKIFFYLCGANSPVPNYEVADFTWKNKIPEIITKLFCVEQIYVQDISVDKIRYSKKFIFKRFSLMKGFTLLKFCPWSGGKREAWPDCSNIALFTDKMPLFSAMDDNFALNLKLNTLLLCSIFWPFNLRSSRTDCERSFPLYIQVQ